MAHALVRRALFVVLLQGGDAAECLHQQDHGADRDGMDLVPWVISRRSSTASTTNPRASPGRTTATSSCGHTASSGPIVLIWENLRTHLMPQMKGLIAVNARTRTPPALLPDFVLAA